MTATLLLAIPASTVGWAQGVEARPLPEIKPSPPKPVRQLELGIDHADAHAFVVPRRKPAAVAAKAGTAEAVRRFYARRPSYGFSAVPVFRDEDRVQELPPADEGTGEIGEFLDSIEIEALVFRVTAPLPF